MASKVFGSVWFRSLRGMLAVLVALAVLLSLLGWWLLGTASGARWLVSTALPYAHSSLPGNMRLEIQGIETDTLADIRIGHLTLSDSEGAWLEMRQFFLRWQPSALWKLRLHVQELGAQHLHLIRTPEAEETPDSTLEEDIDAVIALLENLPDTLRSVTLPPLRLQQLRVDELALGEAILGTASRFVLSGGADLTIRPIQLSFALDSLEGVETTARAIIKGTAEDADFRLRWHEETGGILGTLLPLASPAPLTVEADSTLNDGILTSTLTAHAGEGLLLEAAMALPLRHTARIDWTMTLPEPSLLAPLDGFARPLHAEGSLREEAITLRGRTDSLPNGMQEASVSAEMRLDAGTPPYALHVELQAIQPTAESEGDNKKLHGLLQATGDAERWEIHTLNASLGEDITTAAKGALHLSQGAFFLAGVFTTPQVDGHYSATATSLWDAPQAEALLQLDTLHETLPAPLDETVVLPVRLHVRTKESDGDIPDITATLSSENINGSADIYPQAQDTDPLVVGGIEVQGLPVPLHLTFRHMPTGHGNLELRSDALLLAADYRMEENILNLHRIALEADTHIRLHGALKLDTATSLAQGSLDGYLRSTAPLRGMGIDMPLITAVNGATRLTLSHPRQEQQARLSYGSGFLEMDGTAVAGDVRVDAEARLPAGQAPQLTATIDATTLTFPLSLDHWKIRAQGNTERIDWQMDGKNDSTATRFDTSGHVTMAELLELTVNRLEVAWEQNSLALRAPVTLAYAPDLIHLSKLDLRLNESGSIQAELALSTTESRADIQLSRLPVSALPFGPFAGVKGMLNGKARLSGAPDNPQLQLTLDIDGLQQNYPDMTQIQDQPLTVTLRTTLADQQLSAQLSANAPDAASFAAATAELPVRVSLRPDAPHFAPVGTIDAALKADMVLGPFLPLFMPDGVYGTGHLVADMRLNGALDNPNINGTVDLHSGRIEVLQTGTTIDNIGFAVRAAGNRITLRDGKADDSGKGTLDFSGSVQLTPDMPMEASLDFSQFAVMRHTSGIATMSGTTSLKGDLSDALLKGEWVINSARITIQNGAGGGANIPEIRVIEVASLDDPLADSDYADMTEEEREAMREQRRRDRPFSRNLNMNISIVAENQIFLEGFGLNAELKGRVNIGGVAARPSLSGQMETVRGRWSFFGRTFIVTRGEATLSENNLMAPLIDLRAETQADDITAVAQITGTTENPNIEFTSIPPLPRDEILARVMFGKNLNNISPYQALQLADMLRSLSGAGGGGSLNPLSKLQNTLGIDELKINNDSGSGDDVTVGVGKYVQENIYLEVEGGGAQNSGKVSLEVDITPNISVSTEARQDAESAVRLNYKYDY